MPLFTCLFLIAFQSLSPLQQDKQPSPAEQYQTLLKQHNSASSSGRTLTDEERIKFVGRAYQQRFELGKKLLELAEKYPNDPVAVEALIQAVWQVNNTPWPVELIGKDEARPRAFELLIRDYIASDKLAPLCQRISYGYCKEYETFLRVVLAKNPHRNVQANAALALGQFLISRSQKVDLCQEDHKQAKEFADLFGSVYLADLLKQDSEKVIKEADAILERASKEYADVKVYGDITVAERANRALYEIRHLWVGMVAPDIQGLDQDGVRFKLSDYRGKVVLLDFWSYV